MQIIKKTFTDFDIYNDSLNTWSLEYNILSKNDFRAELNMFSDDLFALSRISLQGKLIHSGHTPIGYRTIVIPINKKDRFIFFNKGSNGNELLVFPKDCRIDAVTFNNFDVFIISIENNFLNSKLKKIHSRKFNEIFGEGNQAILVDNEFLNKFYSLANKFLTKHISNEDFSDNNTTKHQQFVNKIIDTILEELMYAQLNKQKLPKKRKDIALKEAIEIIHNNESLFTVKELSLLTNVSERTLLNAFKEKFNTTPVEYLKAYRLNKVKNELFALKNKNVNISTIAGKYHFWHMGQFAKDFKKQFGFLPSEFLKQNDLS